MIRNIVRISIIILEKETIRHKNCELNYFTISYDFYFLNAENASTLLRYYFYHYYLLNLLSLF